MSDGPNVRIIYSGGYVPDLGIVEDPGFTSYNGWLVYRHPDGQWVNLANLSESQKAAENTRLRWMFSQERFAIKPHEDRWLLFDNHAGTRPKYIETSEGEAYWPSVDAAIAKAQAMTPPDPTPASPPRGGG